MSDSATIEQSRQSSFIHHIDPAELSALLQGNEELALLDVRESGVFAQRHILYATSVPLWRIEQQIFQKVPRLQTRIVLVDDDGALVSEAGPLLSRLGYTNVAILQGGIPAWQRDGYELFSGENVPGKAFGEVVEIKAKTPHISAQELETRIRTGEPLLIVDGRTPEEFHRFSLPGAYNLPNAELPYRIRDLAPDPTTPIVVNCAGRTRSIIGAQTLIDANIPNPVVSLQDGTMAWLLAGYALEHGKRSSLPEPAPAHLHQAQVNARKLAKRAGVQFVSAQTLEQWRNDTQRSTYLFDIRTRDEYRAGHLPGWRWVPGGQLIQATDEYIGTLGARVVIADWDNVRATSVAAWLVQLGKYEVSLYQPGSPAHLETGDAPLYISKDPAAGPVSWISAGQLATLQEQNGATVIDVDSAKSYATRHIRSAYYVVPEHIEQLAPTLRSEAQILIITSSDGILAGLVSDRLTRNGLAASALLGGNRAWFEADLPTESGALNNLSTTESAWLNAYEQEDALIRNQKFNEYLDWEVGLVAQLERKGAEAPFTVLAQGRPDQTP